MRVGAGIIVILLLVLTAGCLGLGSDGSDAEPTVESPSNDTLDGADDDRDAGNDGDESDESGESDESDESNAAATEESGSADDEDVDVPADLELPPGVDEDGIHDVAALLEANDVAISATGYEIEIRQSTGLQRAGSTISRTISEDADGRMMTRHSTNATNVSVEQEYWVDADAGYLHQETDNESYYSVVSADGIRSTLEPSTVLEPSLESYAFDVAGIEEGRIVLEATDASGVGQFSLQSNAENVSATLVLDADGRIHSFEHGYDTEMTDFDYSYRLVRTGDVTLEEPAWTDAARDAATMVDLSVDREDGLLAITHEGGDVLENGTDVVVGTAGREANATLGTFGELETDFGPGDTAYVANTDELESGVSVGESPSVDADPFPETELRVTIVSGTETVEILRVESE